jgi:hypothetical protein
VRPLAQRLLHLRSAVQISKTLIRWWSMRHPNTRRSSIGSLASNSFLWSTVILMAVGTHISLAAVYECRDGRGSSVLTNRQVGLHSCRSIIKESASVSVSPPSNMTPQQPSSAAMSNESSHDHEPSTVFPFVPNDGPDSTPPPSCRQGVNPLNPLIARSCASPDPSSPAQPHVTDAEPR